MEDQLTATKKNGTSKLYFLLSMIVFIFWLLSRLINVYHFTLVGVVFEILWLPVILLTFALPVLSLISWSKEKFNFQSLHLFTLIIIAITALMIILF